jgi:hypothetical protein
MSPERSSQTRRMVQPFPTTGKAVMPQPKHYRAILGESSWI